MAIRFQLYDETSSTLLVGLLGIAALVPLLVVPIYGGAVADAVDRRRLLLFSDVALLAVTLGLLANSLLPNPQIWALYAGEALGTAAYGFQRPARNALTPRLVGEDQLLAAIAVEDVVFTLARVVGPAKTLARMPQIRTEPVSLEDRDSSFQVSATLAPQAAGVRVREAQIVTVRVRIGTEPTPTPTPQGRRK